MPVGRREATQGYSLLYKAGILNMILRANRDCLTALAYHRIEDPFRPGFDTFAPNVSATPAAFRQQMEYVKQHYNVITCEQLVLWLRGQADLPSKAAVITFDDGYRDNLTHAYPVLHELRLSAAIFLTSGIIGSDAPFPWDFAAYVFQHTTKDHVDLPLTGTASWSTEDERELIMRRWLAGLKELPQTERRPALHSLSTSLDVSITPGTFSGLYLGWDEVRELNRSGIEMGSHTMTHPILARVALAQAEQEVRGSKERIEAELRKPIATFAYPNGRRSDFSPPIMALLREAGFKAAFTLMAGPTRRQTVKREPLAIRRVFVSHKDTLPRFVAKLAGFARLAGS